MSYMRKFSCPMTLKGASSHNSEKPKQSKPWLKPPRKLVTSSFLSGSRSFKPPVARVPRSSTASRASAASRSPAAVVTAPSTMAKRCRAAAKQAAEAGDGDDDDSVCTEADASLRAAVAADVATIERDEFEADAYADEVDYSDVRLGDVEEDAARARKRAKVAPPADDDASSVGGDTALASESGDTVVDADGDGAEDFALGVETLRSVEPAKVDAKKGVRYLPTPAVADDAAPAHFLEARFLGAAAAKPPGPPGAGDDSSDEDDDDEAASAEGDAADADAAWFLEPVDPEGMGIDHYPTIVAAPMDFGTVKAKLAAGAYGAAATFAADVRLVLRNAMTFNVEATEPVHAAAAWLYDKFEERYADALADVLDDDDDDGGDGGDHEDVGRAAKHKFAGLGKAPWTGVVVAGTDDTLTIKWAENDEPETYAAAKARRWLL
ncbi:hypothetical protein JL722_13810 [Aureococcus anophagefferens]|nr:hypothetical protein JL722_13810 [Aureococcus anophagefferens]